MSTSPTVPSKVSQPEATFAGAVLSGLIVALGVVAALALTGALDVAATGLSSALSTIGRWLGALPSADAHVFWYMARSAGVVAYGLLWLSVAWGLMVTNKVLDGVARPLVTFELHQFLSVAALAFAGFHAFILLGDGFVNFELADILIPFKSAYQPVGVGLGILSFYLSALLAGSFYVKRRIGHRAWRLLHYASFPAWLMVTLHGLAAGTDSRTPLMQGLYVTAIASVGFLMTYRILVTRARRARTRDESGAQGQRKVSAMRS